MEEVKLGHLSGPFTETEMDRKFGKTGWLFNKRFALHQRTPENPKVRVIDDCRRSGLNRAYTTTNKLELLDVDVLASMSVILDLLGWEPARVGTKAADFTSEFSALGITIRLQELHLGHFTLANEVGRIPKIVQMLRKIKRQGEPVAMRQPKCRDTSNLPRVSLPPSPWGLSWASSTPLARCREAERPKSWPNYVRSQSTPSQPCRPGSFQHVQGKDPPTLHGRCLGSGLCHSRPSLIQPGYPGADSTEIEVPGQLTQLSLK